VKPFLILQLRPEDEASDGEYACFLKKSGLSESDTVRIRLEQQDLPSDLSLDDYSGVIVGGGPGCVSDDPATKDPVEAKIEADILSLMPEIVERDYPFLGCCYGIGVLAHHLGAEVSKRRYSEPVSGVACQLTTDGSEDPLLQGVTADFRAFVGHKEAVQELPYGSAHLVASDNCPIQMIRHGQNVYATQFHPEADGPEFADRIRIYRSRGYFPPEEADALTAACLAETIDQPEKILSNFVRIYAR